MGSKIDVLKLVAPHVPVVGHKHGTELVMQQLRQLDQVAFVRFASVTFGASGRSCP